MEKCNYKQVITTCEKKPNEIVGFSWTPFLRQLLVCSGLWTAYFFTGLSLGSPTVVIPQIRRQANSSEAVTDDLASWLSSALSYSSLPWVVVLPVMTRLIGRKKLFIFVSCTSVISFAIFYAGTTTMHFLISQIIMGILFSSNLTISIIMVTEYTSPQYRGIFLTIKSASVFWGMWVSNAIGTFFPWHNIGLFGLMCSVSYLSAFIWPESPYWLASKGRFQECAKAHRWLKGVDEKSEKELEGLISSQREYLETCVEDTDLRNRVGNYIKTISCREFYQPILISILVMSQFHASGKVVCSMYSIELIKKITDSESTAYIGMLVLDGVSVLGMYFGCALSKFLKRRTLLLVSSTIGITFLLIISLYLWLVELSVISENKFISIFLLSAFFITISCGPMIMSTSIYGEIIPLKFKSSAVIIIVLVHSLLMSNSIKLAPFIFKTFSLQGTFAFYGILAAIFTILLYKYLPETKDKTLQEIEEYFKDNTKSEGVTKKVIKDNNFLSLVLFDNFSCHHNFYYKDIQQDEVVPTILTSTDNGIERLI